MTTPEERLATLRGAADECDGGGDDDELLRLLLRDDENPHPVCLACFEPSDAMPVAQCVGTAIRARAAARAGCRVRIVVADTLALLGGKMDGGDWARVRDAARRNVGELEAALKALGVGGGEVEFLSSSDEILRRRAAEYWGPLVMDVAQKFSVQRVLLGRDEKKLTAGQFLSTIMQCADVFFFQVDCSCLSSTHTTKGEAIIYLYIVRFRSCCNLQN